MNKEALQQYINDCRAHQCTDIQIAQLLEQAGWHSADYLPLLNLSTFSNPTVSPKKSRLTLIIGIALIVLIIVCAAIWWLYFRTPAPSISIITETQQISSTPTVSTEILTPTPAATDATSFTSAQVINQFEQLITSNSIEIVGQSRGALQGCVGNASYHGIKTNATQYALDESQFDPVTKPLCPENAFEVYFETYWIDDKIYYRQYQDKAFEEKPADQNIILATQPQKYLTEYAPVASSITDFTQVDSSTVTFTASVTAGPKGKYSLSFNNQNELTYFTYDLTDPESGSVNAGSIKISVPQQLVTPPPLPTPTR